MIYNNKREHDYFINKVKGALMYMGGDFENRDLTDMTARDFIRTCFTNDVMLSCYIKGNK